MEKDIANMDPKKLPDVVAFQDEYTRGFMASTDEMEDGYYLFESKTGGYTMWYPADARMNSTYYERLNENFESVTYGGNSEKITGAIYDIYATYDHRTKSVDPDILLGRFESSLQYEGDFEKEVYDNTTNYFAQSKYVLPDKQSSVYSFFGLIQSNSSNQSVHYQYHVRCPDEQKRCDYDLEAIENEVRRLMESIQFIPN